MQNKDNEPDSSKGEWLRCPHCKRPDDVYIATNYDREVQFICASCEARSGMNCERSWSSSKAENHEVDCE